MAHAARALGLGVMLGCMVESGLGRRRRPGREPLRPRRPRRQPAARRGPVAGRRARRRRSASRRRARPRRPSKRYLILAEGHSADPHYGKTARGVIRYGPTRSSRSWTRRGRARRTRASRSSATVDDALLFEPDDGARRRRHPGRPLPAGLARAAEQRISNGLDVENGLHEFLADDPELAELAREHGVELRDLRRPPADLNVPTGENLELPAQIVLTVGSDCAIGKMTVALELDREARRRGLASQFVPTGQTGIAIAGWGIAVDAVVSDFLAGAAERLVVEGAAAAASCSSSRARARCPSGVLGRHARPDPRHGPARLRALPPGRGDRDRGLPGPPASAASPSSSSCTSGSRCRRAPRGWPRRAQHGAAGRRRGAGGDRARPRRRPACRRTTPSGSAPARWSTPSSRLLSCFQDRRKTRRT